LRGYLRRVLAGEPAVFQSETLPPEERARETLALGLRRAEGIDRNAFQAQTGFDLEALAGPAIARHVDLGLLCAEDQRVRLTRRGKYVADAVITWLF
jgi:oxygen-independent coproporphyrinogen-3 oxidase